MPGRQRDWWENLINYAVRPLTDVWSAGSAEALWSTLWDNYGKSRDQQFDDIMANAEEDPLGTQGKIASSGLTPSGESEKYLDNLIAAQNTQSARLWEEQMANNDLLRAASQLEKLGLSASGVLQTGGSQVNAVGAADNVKSNIAMQRYAQKMAIAKQLLGMTSQMASAGVYGHAIGAARKASSIVTSAASHSALSALEPTRFHGNRAQLIKDLEDMNPPAQEYDMPF